MRSCCTNARQACKTLPGTSLDGPQTGPGTCCALAWKADGQFAEPLHGDPWKAHRQALAPAAHVPGKLRDNWQNSCTDKPPTDGPLHLLRTCLGSSETIGKTAARTSLEGPQTGPCTCCARAWEAQRQPAKQLDGQAWKAHRRALAPAAHVPGKLTDN